MNCTDKISYFCIEVLEVLCKKSAIVMIVKKCGKFFKFIVVLYLF